ncbi:MAG: restriction endonuclease subunit S [Bacillota bacterium]
MNGVDYFTFSGDRAELQFRADAEYHHPKYKLDLFNDKILFKLGEITETSNRKIEDNQEYNYIELNSIEKQTNKIKRREELEVYSYQDLPSRAKTIVKEGDILLSKLGNKSITVVDEEHEGCVASNTFIVFRPTVAISSITLAFILQLKEVKKQFAKYSYGVRKRITNRNFKRIKVPLLNDKDELETIESLIINYINKKDKIIQNYKNLSAKLEKLLLNELSIMINKQEENDSFAVNGDLIVEDNFNPEFYNPEYLKVVQNLKDHQYPNYKLKDIIKKLTVGRPLSSSAKGNVEYLTAKNIDEIEIDTSELEKAKMSGKIPYLKNGDLILISAGHKLGTTAIVTETEEDITFNNHLYRLVPGSKINEFYLLVYLNSILGSKQFQRYKSGGVQPSINKRDILNLEILLPPSEIQDEITNKLIRKYSKIKKDYQELEQEKEKIEAEIINMLTKETIN